MSTNKSKNSAPSNARRIQVGTTKRGIKARPTIAGKLKEAARKRKPPPVGEVVEQAEGLFSRKDNLRSDMRMVMQGAKHRWDMPSSIYKEVPHLAQAVMNDQNPETGEPGNYNIVTRLVAGKLLATLHGQNQKETHHEEGENLNVNHSGAILVGVEQRQATLSAIASELGIDDVVEEAAQD